MVNIDTVYQRVLAVANKEQRGYITPQEFNLLANQAQMDIFEQYFYDLNQFSRIPNNNTEYADMVKLLDEKISIFKTSSSLVYSSPNFILPGEIYRLGSIIYNVREVERVSDKELSYINISPLTKPSLIRPIYVKNNGSIRVYPDNIQTNVFCNFIRKPLTPSWGYVVVNEKALYNANNTTHFEIHDSESVELVNKILLLAGITLKSPDLSQLSLTEQQQKIQQEKQ